MKIKITKHIPVQNPPAIGSIHEVLEKQRGRDCEGTPAMIDYDGEIIGVWRHECEIVTE